MVHNMNKLMLIWKSAIKVKYFISKKNCNTIAEQLLTQHICLG